MLAALPRKSQDTYEGDFYIADEAIGFGRVESTASERQNFWRRWKEYVRPIGVDPYLRNEEFGTIVRATTGFAGRVRAGHLGRGHTVTCPRVQTAVRAIGQTCELDLGYNPLHMAPDRYLKPLELMFAGFRRADPPPVPEIAIPVAVPEQVACIGLYEGATPKEQAQAA